MPDKYANGQAGLYGDQLEQFKNSQAASQPDAETDKNKADDAKTNAARQRLALKMQQGSTGPTGLIGN